MNENSDFLREEPPAYSGGGKSDPVAEYLRKIEHALLRRDATEHTHRPALKEFLESLIKGITATNEPRRSACGAPDYVVSRSIDRLTIGYVEAKDVGAELHVEEKSEQLRRYRRLLPKPNLILTDYLEFRWFTNGESRGVVRLAAPKPNGKLTPVPSVV